MIDNNSVFFYAGLINEDMDKDIRKKYKINVPVSYTHLDVYKRQAPGQGSNVWTSLMGQNPVSIPVMYSNGYIPAPVSYTHLKHFPEGWQNIDPFESYRSLFNGPTDTLQSLFLNAL